MSKLNIKNAKVLGEELARAIEGKDYLKITECIHRINTESTVVPFMTGSTYNISMSEQMTFQFPPDIT